MAAILDTALLQALLLTGQPSAALELLKGLNYCDVKICEELLQKGNHYAALLEVYKSNSMHCEALKLLHQLVEESKTNQSHAQEFGPEAIIDYLKVSLLVGRNLCCFFCIKCVCVMRALEFLGNPCCVGCEKT